MHALLNTKKTSLKNKGGYIDYLLAPNRARKGYKAIKLNDRIIVDVGLSQKSYNMWKHKTRNKK